MQSDRKQIALFARGTLAPGDKEAFAEAGYLAVEVDDPGAVVLLAPATPMVGVNDLFMAALHGLNQNGATNERANFVAELHRRLKANEANEANEAMNKGATHE